MARDNVPRDDVLDEADRLVKADDTAGDLGTTARLWINTHLPELAREHFPGASPRILDLGCGDGPNARLLADAGIGGSYLGVDLASSPLWPSRTGIRGRLDVRFATHDAHHIGDFPGTFDALISVSAFEHFRDDHGVAAGLARILRPGARGVVIVPSWGGNLIWGFKHGFRTYDPPRFRRMLEGTPLRVLDAIPAGAIPSLVFNATWRAASMAVTYSVLGAVWLRHLGDRRAAERAHPWIPRLAGNIQFGHLTTETGRNVHRSLNHRLLDLDDRVPSTPTQWAFVIERA